jgi:AcrR family transcriptional regulator
MTRQHLLDAAAIVFAEKGFHGASLDEIAAAAGFTKGAVYSNFKSKDDLFLALLEDKVERQSRAIEERLLEQDTAEAQLDRVRDVVVGPEMRDEQWSILFYEFLLYAVRNPEARVKFAAENRRIIDGTTQMIERAYSQFGITSRFPIRALAVISTAIFEGLAEMRLIDPAAVDDEMMNITLDFLYEAFGAGELPVAPDADGGGP